MDPVAIDPPARKSPWHAACYTSGGGAMSEAFKIDLNGTSRPLLALVETAVIAAKTGWSRPLNAGQAPKIIDPPGKQIADFSAFNGADFDGQFSATHGHVWIDKPCPRPLHVAIHEAG
jgi:uncharacterized protein YcgI (DUF1989 family)